MRIRSFPRFIALAILSGCALFSCVGQKAKPASKSDYSVTVSFSGPAVSPPSVYACWIEDEGGADLQNLYVCNSAVGIGKTLTGTALPNWKTRGYTVNANVDGVTGASVQGSKGLGVTRALYIGDTRRFRVCFEIDRSLNDNASFGDRPAFSYRSEIIDLDSLSAEYPLSLYGWMADETASGTYSQKPKADIPGYATFKLMADLAWIAPPEDMVTSLKASVSSTK